MITIKFLWKVLTCLGLVLLFQNVIKALVMCQPPDPLRFIVWYLKHRHHEDVPKIILVAPPGLVTAGNHNQPPRELSQALRYCKIVNIDSSILFRQSVHCTRRCQKHRSGNHRSAERNAQAPEETSVYILIYYIRHY